MTWCSVCDRYFGSTNAFWQHVDNSARHECECCYYHFANEDDEDDHGYEGENEEDVPDEALDEALFAAGEMKNVDYI